MNREEVLEQILEIPNNNVLITLPTGFGKTKIAIERVKHLAKPNNTLLIVVPRNILKLTWKEEIDKWWSNCNIDYQFTTYVSLHKYTGHWNFVIFDEAHHLSERCRDTLDDFSIDNSILLSATVKKDLKQEFKGLFSNLYCYNISLRDAINNEVLPDPTVYLIPLTLDNKNITETIIKNPKAKGRIIECSWATRWQYINQKNYPVRINCTKRQYLEDLNSQIDWYKRRAIQTRNEVVKTKWLKLCGDRLKFLSNSKTSFILELLLKFNKYRTLTFCNNIEQTELLGKFCINSKNKESNTYLEYFNNGTIDHITTCNMLNEGCNLSNCQIGIYANLNSSETIVKQRTGRLLRHKNPVIIIPYYKNTREEELVNKMLEDYNPNLVKTVNFISEIIL